MAGCGPEPVDVWSRGQTTNLPERRNDVQIIEFTLPAYDGERFDGSAFADTAGRRMRLGPAVLTIVSVTVAGDGSEVSFAATLAR